MQGIGHPHGANDNSGVDRDEHFNYSSFLHLHMIEGQLAEPIPSPRLSMRIEYFPRHRVNNDKLGTKGAQLYLD